MNLKICIRAGPEGLIFLQQNKEKEYKYETH